MMNMFSFDFFNLNSLSLHHLDHHPLLFPAVQGEPAGGAEGGGAGPRAAATGADRAADGGDPHEPVLPPPAPGGPLTTPAPHDVAYSPSR